MGRHTRRLVAGALVLLGAGVAAAANNSFIAGPSPGIAIFNTPPTQTAAATATTSSGATISTTGDTTTVSASTPTTTMPTTTTATATTPSPAALPSSALSVEQIVSVTRTVEAGGAPVSAFTVPAGRRLIVTDVVVTNPAMTPACGATVTTGSSVTPTPVPAPNATASTTPAAAPTVATGDAGTGPLCVPAQTSLMLTLTTGLEFDAGQSVVLANQAAATTTGAAAAGALHYHLRGFLVQAGA